MNVLALPITPPSTPPSRPSLALCKEANYPRPAYLTAFPPTPPATPPTAAARREETAQRIIWQEASSETQYQSRRLTNNELSYFLPSRSDGVNDMYVHHRLGADPTLLSQARVLYIWAYQLLRHPLLASSILVNSYDDAHFVRALPRTVDQAIQQASERFHPVSTSPHHSIIDTYLNGPRTLSAERLSCLIFATPPSSGLLTPPSSPRPDGERDIADDYELMLCAAHSIGDGMALHTFMNEFYTLLSSQKSSSELRMMIADSLDLNAPAIPRGLEERFSVDPHPSAWKDVVEKVDHELHQTRLTGNQSFPLVPFGQRRTRRTVVPTVAYTPDETKQILGRCKANGVTIAHAVFALCNMAWAQQSSSRDSCIIYSAANLRPQMSPSPAESFFHLAIGYFNISLPCLHVPIPTSDLMWHRARSVKSQMIKATRTSFITSRAKKTGVERCERAVKWAKVDDGVADEATPSSVPPMSLAPSAPQKALMGVSMLGNLDGMYKHANFAPIKLYSLMTGSRQRSAGLLLFAYTFCGQLWISLGYDVNGFAPGVIDGFWEGVQGLVSDVMLRA